MIFFLLTMNSIFPGPHSCTGTQNCRECGEFYSSMTARKRHKKIHSEEKLHCCEICGKGKLTTHQIIHTGDKPFKCGKCGRCFADKANMLRHEKIHTGEKPQICDICGKSCYRRHDLIKHLKTHSNVKSFCC